MLGSTDPAATGRKERTVRAHELAHLVAKLEPDYGQTAVALANGRILQQIHGRPVRVELYYGGQPHDYNTVVVFEDGAPWIFTGFSWGYGGEGCRGLHAWCMDNEVPLTLAEISGFNNTQASPLPVWSWLDSDTAERIASAAVAELDDATIRATLGRLRDAAEDQGWTVRNMLEGDSNVSHVELSGCETELWCQNCGHTQPKGGAHVNRHGWGPKCPACREDDLQLRAVDDG